MSALNIYASVAADSCAATQSVRRQHLTLNFHACCHAGRNNTMTSDASEQQAAQQLLGGILGLLGLNVTDLANSTSDASSNSTSMSDNSLFG